MDILKQSDLKELIETPREWCVSIYLPTHRFGREQQQDPIRFKNLITRAQERLVASGPGPDASGRKLAGRQGFLAASK